MPKNDNSRSHERKKPWNHSRLCSYCESEKVPGEFMGGKACRHFRGGKSRSDRGQNW